MISTIILLGIVAAVSVVINVIMISYARHSLSRLDMVYAASEKTSEIFSMIDTYKVHLNAVYEMPTFYGDETLQSLLQHTENMIEFLKRYDEIYSFTQPDLEEQLLAATTDLDEDEEEAQE